LFWTESVEKAVWRVSLASNDTVPLANSEISQPYGIIVDCTKKRVYWFGKIDRNDDRILSNDYNGLDKEIVFKARAYKSHYSLGLLGDSLYFMSTFTAYVNKLNASNVNVSSKILVESNSYYDLVIVHSSIQPQERICELQ
jgi:hypothetical protein